MQASASPIAVSYNFGIAGVVFAPEADQIEDVGEAWPADIDEDAEAATKTKRLDDNRPLAIVTGASSGIGYELAKICVSEGFDLVIASDEEEIHAVGEELRGLGANVTDLRTDLATLEGVDELVSAARQFNRPVRYLFANAGLGIGGNFVDENFDDVQHVLDTNITGTIYLIHKVGNDMRRRGEGKILITGSIAGFMPGSFQAVYNGTKAFIDSFSFAIREELKDTGITITCLMPGATETEFFERADLMDTKIGTAKKDDAQMVAEVGYKAMVNGEGDVVSGWKNKIQSSLANVTPAGVLARQHRSMAEPGSAKQ